MSEIAWIIIEAAAKCIVIVSLLLFSAAFSVYVERKVSAAIQDRIGPNRVGPFGTFQPFADVIKLFMKEDLVPKVANPWFHKLAPIISLGVAVAVYAVIPLAHYIDLSDGTRIFMGVAPNVNIGVLYILALTSVGVYGIALAGWSSNNKYSLMGGLRSAAQMISYELSMGLAIIGVIIITGSLTLNDIILGQQGYPWEWNIVYQPLGFIIFLVAQFAEANRAPFDLPEAEPELVGGFNTEYSGMKFGMFFLAEYANMATASAMIAILYLGGWSLPFPHEAIGLESGSILLALLQFGVLLAKIIFLIFFFVWVRWSIPRFRYDQLMKLGWVVLLPLALLNVAITGLLTLIL